MFRLLWLVATLISVPVLAFSHPHVWIDAQVEAKFGGATLQAVMVTWDFDPDYSLLILTDYDANGNGRFEASEVPQVRKGYFDNLKRYGYFTRMVQGTTRVALGALQDFTALVLAGNRVRFQFTLPATATVQKGKPLVLAFYDETMFVDIGFVGGSSARLASEAPVVVGLQKPPQGAFPDYNPEQSVFFTLKN